MSKTLSQVRDIVKKVTGRTDQSVSDDTIYDYIEDFYMLIMGQEMRIFDRRSFYEFDTAASTDEYPIDLPTIGYSILEDPVWIDGFRINFYTDPLIFFSKWPETQDYTEQRPTDVLWYGGKLTFRSIPDAVYSVKIKAYIINAGFGDKSGSENIAEDFWFRYLAYGAAIDLLSDSGEFEKVAQIIPLFERYKGIVNSRTYTQLKDRKVIRNF